MTKTKINKTNRNKTSRNKTKKAKKEIYPLSKKEIYQQAKKNVLREGEKELREEIRAEYQRIAYELEKELMTPKIRVQIKELKRKLWTIPVTGIGGGYQRNGIEFSLDCMLEDRLFHPKQFQGIKKYIESKAVSRKK